MKRRSDDGEVKPSKRSNNHEEVRFQLTKNKAIVANVNMYETKGREMCYWAHLHLSCSNIFSVIEFKFDTLFCKQRDDDEGQNPAFECNMEEERERSRNIYVMVDVSLAKRKYDVRNRWPHKIVMVI